MKAIFWKVRCAYWYWRIASLPLRMCWSFAGASWDMDPDDPLSPLDAVREELSCWSE